MKIDRNTEVDLSTIELFLGLKKSRISEIEKDGVVVKTGHGKYLIVETVLNYHRYLRRNSFQSEGGTVIDFNEQRARKVKLEADALDLKNQIDNGKFIQIEEVTADIDDALAVVARILGDLKLNIGRHAPQLPNRALDLIEKECAKALTAICDLDESYKEANENYQKSVAADFREIQTDNPA